MRLRESEFLCFCFSNNVNKIKSEMGRAYCPGGSKTKVSDYFYGPIWGFLAFFV